jgi:RNA polymerase sigma factor (sigma-70 family)
MTSDRSHLPPQAGVAVLSPGEELPPRAHLAVAYLGGKAPAGFVQGGADRDVAARPGDAGKAEGREEFRHHVQKPRLYWPDRAKIQVTEPSKPNGARPLVSRRDSGALFSRLNYLCSHGTLAGLSEREILDRFIVERDEVALAALIARHGSMVLGVCRRILRDEHAIEDAFQATFLVFARRAGTIRGNESVGRWLHGVAYRISVRTRANCAKRRVRESQSFSAGLELEGTSKSPEAVARFHELRDVIDEELMRLPWSLRAPVVLCYLEGITHEEAANQLGWPVGTVRSRMARARRLLKRRLTRRGVDPNAGSIPILLARPNISVDLINATVRTSLHFVAPKPLGSGVASATAATLANEVLKIMILTRWTVVCAAGLIVALALEGPTVARQIAGLVASKAPAGKTGQKAAAALPGAKRTATERDQADAPSGPIAEQYKKVLNLQSEFHRLKASLETEGAAIEERAKALQLRQRSLSSLSAQYDEEVDKLKELVKEEDNRSGKKVDTVALDAVVKWVAENDVRTLESGSNEPSIKNAGVASVPKTSVGKGQHKIKSIQSDNGLYVCWWIEGPDIRRVGVFSRPDKKWYIQELRQPVDKAIPVTDRTLVVYPLGRFIYAFSVLTKSWDVLTLPAGNSATPKIQSVSPAGKGNGPSHFGTNGPIEEAEIEHNGIFYTFNAATGKWSELNPRKTFGLADDHG